MHLDHLNVLAAFLAVAEERRFTKAAKRLGVSRSALSHEGRACSDAVGRQFWIERSLRLDGPDSAREREDQRLAGPEAPAAFYTGRPELDGSVASNPGTKSAQVIEGDSAVYHNPSLPAQPLACKLLL